MSLDKEFDLIVLTTQSAGAIEDHRLDFCRDVRIHPTSDLHMTLKI